MQWQTFLAPPPVEGSKGQISFNFNYKVNFKDFMPNFVCVLTNERYKTYQTGFLFCRLGGTLVCWGCARWVKNIILFKHGHVAYQIDPDDKQNRMQVKISS